MVGKHADVVDKCPSIWEAVATSVAVGGVLPNSCSHNVTCRVDVRLSCRDTPVG